MAITGLESDYYCVHCPIPVSRPGDTGGQATRLQILINNVEMLTNPPVLCSTSEGAFLDIAPWVRQFMPKIEDLVTYTAAVQTIPNPYIQEMTVRLYTSSGDDSEVKNFVHCSDEEGVMTDEYTDIKSWSCYPFSYEQDNNIITQVLTNTAPVIAGKIVDHDTECCKGTYVKWLNDSGYYSYWLFKKSVSEELEAEEIYYTPEDIFANPRIKGRVTAGLTPTDTITVREKISDKYYEMLRSLIYSPDVYIIRDDYVLGSDVSPSDWKRVTQDSPSIELDRRNNTIEFELDLVLPEPCTIKRI